MKKQLASLGAAIAVAFVASSLRAQDSSAQGAAADSGTESPQASGLLGQTYLSIDATLVHFQDISGSPDAFGGGFGANLPFADHFDYSLDYGADFSRSHDFHLSDNVIENSVTAYYKFGHVSPFLSAGFGYEWERLTSLATPVSLPNSFDRLDYDLGAGLEFPLSQAASLRARIGDDDASLRSPHARGWDYELSANYWLGSVVGTFVGADVRNGRGGGLNQAEFTVGFRFLLSSD
jgi:hypothetical protein